MLLSGPFRVGSLARRDQIRPTGAGILR